MTMEQFGVEECLVPSNLTLACLVLTPHTHVQDKIRNDEWRRSLILMSHNEHMSTSSATKVLYNVL